MEAAQPRSAGGSVAPEPGTPRTGSGSQRHALDVGLDSARDACVQHALRLIGNRPHTRGELLKKLSRKGHDARVVSIAVDRVVELGYVDDDAIARRRAEKLVRDGRGPGWIRDKLRKAGVAEHVIRAATDEARPAGGWAVAAAEWLRDAGKTPSADADQKELNRAFGRLARRGYPASAARAAIFDYGDS